MSPCHAGHTHSQGECDGGKQPFGDIRYEKSNEEDESLHEGKAGDEPAQKEK